VDQARLVRYAATAFQRARQAGIEIIVFGSGGARQIPDGFSQAKAEEQFLAYLKELGPLAAQHNVTVVIEPLNAAECNFILSVPEADALVQAANHPNIGVLADFYHMTRQGQTPDDIRRHGARLRHVHVAENADRTAPGIAGDDFRPFLRALRDTGYRGAIAIECKWRDFAADVRTGVAALRRQLTDTYA
jgi:sugar phosphate isomerase/epimerase